MTPVQICNLALTRAGQTTIAALGVATEEERACARHLPALASAMLQEFVWPWSITATALLSGTDDRDDWEYAYQKSAGHLLVVGCHDSLDWSVEYDFELWGDQVYCDALNPLWEVVCEYTGAELAGTPYYDIGDMLFCDALAYRLAAALVMQFGGAERLHQQLIGLYELALRRAKANAGKIDQTRLDPMAEYGQQFVDARE